VGLAGDTVAVAVHLRSIAWLTGAREELRNARLPAAPRLVSTDRMSATPARLRITIAMSAMKRTTPR